MVAEAAGGVVVDPKVGGGGFAFTWLQKPQWSFVSLEVIGVEGFLANCRDDRLKDF